MALDYGADPILWFRHSRYDLAVVGLEELIGTCSADDLPQRLWEMTVALVAWGNQGHSECYSRANLYSAAIDQLLEEPN